MRAETLKGDAGTGEKPAGISRDAAVGAGAEMVRRRPSVRRGKAKGSGWLCEEAWEIGRGDSMAVNGG